MCGTTSMSRKKASLMSGRSMRFTTKPGLSSERIVCMPMCRDRASVALKTCNTNEPPVPLPSQPWQGDPKQLGCLQSTSVG